MSARDFRNVSRDVPDATPHLGISILGLLWVLFGWVGVEGAREGGASVLGLVAAVAGASTPLLLVRILGSRAAVKLPVWGAAAGLHVGGLVAIARATPLSLADDEVSRAVAVTAIAAASALVLACGVYVVARSIGSNAAERRAIFAGSAAVLAMGVAVVFTWVAVSRPGPSPLRLAGLVLFVLQGAAAAWTYVLLLRARPRLRDVDRVFE